MRRGDIRHEPDTSSHLRATQAVDVGDVVVAVTDGLGMDSWLLVLLFAHSSALLAFSCVSRSFAHPSVQSRAHSVSISIMQLAAWLRCGMNMIQEELPHYAMPGLPTTCNSWVEVLHRQEVRGEFCSLLFVDCRGRLFQDFIEAVETLNRETSVHAEYRPAIYILPSTSQHVHLSDNQSASIQIPVSVHGLSLPSASATCTTLRMKSLKIRTSGKVELHNLLIIGSGSDSSAPRGVCDSVIWVTAGACDICDVDVSLPEGRAGFGISVGKAVGTSSQDAHVTLCRTTVSRCSTGCIAYNGGQLSVDAESVLFSCNVGLSACDGGSQVAVAAGALIATDIALKVQEVSGGVVRIEP